MWLNDRPTAKVCKEINRKLPTRTTQIFIKLLNNPASSMQEESAPLASSSGFLYSAFAGELMPSSPPPPKKLWPLL